MNLTPQVPATGILKHSDWGDSKSYVITCDCGGDDHSHLIDVEATDFGVEVTLYTTEYLSPMVHGFWKSLYKKIKITWNIWIDGNIKYQADVIFNQQQALNYAETLKNAMHDVEDFKNQPKKKYGI